MNDKETGRNLLPPDTHKDKEKSMGEGTEKSSMNIQLLRTL